MFNLGCTFRDGRQAYIGHRGTFDDALMLALEWLRAAPQHNISQLIVTNVITGKTCVELTYHYGMNG